MAVSSSSRTTLLNIGIGLSDSILKLDLARILTSFKPAPTTVQIFCFCSTSLSYCKRTEIQFSGFSRLGDVLVHCKYTHTHTRTHAEREKHGDDYLDFRKWICQLVRQLFCFFVLFNDCLHAAYKQESS